MTRLNAEFTRALAMADVSASIDKMGFEVAPMSLAESHRFVVAEAEKWARSVRLSGAKAE
jgi:hypothetical protein